MTRFLIHDIKGDVRSAVLSCQACWCWCCLRCYIIILPWHVRVYRTSIGRCFQMSSKSWSYNWQIYSPNKLPYNWMDGVNWHWIRIQNKAVRRFLFLNFSFFAFNRFYFLTTLFLLYSFCNMHKEQIQYAIQICNTKYNMHKVHIYFAYILCIYTLCTLQRFLSAQLVSIYEERIRLRHHVSCCLATRFVAKQNTKSRKLANWS